MALFVMVMVLWLTCSESWLLSAPHEYSDGERISLKVDKLTSLRTLVPYDYYSLPFCKPEVIKLYEGNLGQALSGEVIHDSTYEINMRAEDRCQVLCRVSVEEEDKKMFSDMIKQSYSVNWEINNLRVASLYYTGQLKDEESDPRHAGYVKHYEVGFPLGFTKNDRLTQHQAFMIGDSDAVYINNHVNIKILYHNEEDSEGHTIVGFEVDTKSVDHELLTGGVNGTEEDVCQKNFEKWGHNLDSNKPKSLNAATKYITFTYGVQFEESSISWASRWDMFDRFGWISWRFLMMPVIIVAAFTTLVAVVMVKILRKDSKRYNAIINESVEDIEVEQVEDHLAAWTLLHGDVFRPPQHASLLSTFVGTGVQTLATAVLMMVFAMIGFFSHENRGGMMTALLIFYALMGIFAGYASSRIYIMFGLTEWRKNALQTALFLPAIAFTTFLVLQFILWMENSSASVSLGTIFALLFLWIGISAPLTFLGAYAGARKQEIKAPVQVNFIPRIIPRQSWYINARFTILLGGLFPFGACFMENTFLMGALFRHTNYHSFGFMIITFVLLLFICAEVAIVMCYWQLRSENYEWWWRSFFTCGSLCLYLFLHYMLYFVTTMETVKLASTLLFFGYTFLILMSLFFLVGTIGFVASLLFMRNIYSHIKASI